MAKQQQGVSHREKFEDGRQEGSLGSCELVTPVAEW
jgi:hypothetical protein